MSLLLSYRIGNEKKISVPASHTFDIYNEYPNGGREIVGEFCLLFTHKVVSLWGLHIEPEHRGKKYARRTLEAVIQALRDQGRHTLALYVKPDNEPAIKLYQSLGFKEIPQQDSNSIYYEYDLTQITVGNLPHYGFFKQTTI